MMVSTNNIVVFTLNWLLLLAAHYMDPNNWRQDTFFGCYFC
jgi:hypothetical protein